MKLTRRNFVKASLSTVAATAAIGMGSNGELVAEAVAAVSKADFGIERQVFLCCRMCAQFCPMIGYVRDERLVRLEANPNSPYPAICGRGKAAIGALYNPDRIKTPLIRVGERGEGEFREASWDEALDMVATKLKELRDSNESHSVAYMPRFNTAIGLDDYFIKCYGTPNTFSYADGCFASANELGFGSIFTGGKESRAGNSAVMGDYENAKLAVLISRNPAGGLVAFPWGAAYGRGRKNGLKTVLIDPRKAAGTGETDTEWLPVIPGRDIYLLMGLTKEIFDNKYYDEEYLVKYTNSDMLVNLETFQAYSMADSENETASGKDYMVYDEVAQDFVMKSKSTQPAILGEFEINGVAVKTGLQMLIDSTKGYTVEEMAEKSGITVEQIKKLAKDLNDTKPACFLERGYRATRYYNSTQEKHLIAVVNGLLGVYGRKGGLVYGRTVKLKSPLTAPKIEGVEQVDKYYKENVKGFELIKLTHMRRLFPKAVLDEKPYKMKFAFINGLNSIGGGGGADMATALTKMEMILCISPYWNETTMFADVILPDTTFMERSEPPVTGFKATFPVIALHQQAVAPMYQAKNGYWIIEQLAQRIFTPAEYDKYFGEFSKGGVDYLTQYGLDNITGMTANEKSNFNVSTLYSNGIWCGDSAKVIPKAKNTATGKLEIYSLFMSKWHDKLLKEKRYNDAKYFTPLITWAPPYWMTKKETLDYDEFIPITGFHPLSSFTGAQTRNNILLSTIGSMLDYDAVFMNREKGESLGLTSNDIVEIYNIDRPSMVTKARVVLTDTVNPTSLFSFYGVGSGYFNKMSDKLSVASKIGFNPNHVATHIFAPVEGSASSQDFIVKVRRAN